VQCDVHIDAGPTSLDPSQTSFFQALGISTTKINKGHRDPHQVHLAKVGSKVGSSEATLLGKTQRQKALQYGLVITKV
jgi:large subunit ribosomal protein LP0